MRFSIRESLMVIAIVALILPYVLPKWRPAPELPELLHFSIMDVDSWTAPFLPASTDFRGEAKSQTGVSVDSHDGDIETNVPLGSSNAIVSLWKKNIDSKISVENWVILDAWEGENWFEYEFQKQGSIRRLFCAIRPPASSSERPVPNGQERIRIVWLNSGFKNPKLQQPP